MYPLTLLVFFCWSLIRIIYLNLVCFLQCCSIVTAALLLHYCARPYTKTKYITGPQNNIYSYWKEKLGQGQATKLLGQVHNFHPPPYVYFPISTFSLFTLFHPNSSFATVIWPLELFGLPINVNLQQCIIFFKILVFFLVLLTCKNNISLKSSFQELRKTALQGGLKSHKGILY